MGRGNLRFVLIELSIGDPSAVQPSHLKRDDDERWWQLNQLFMAEWVRRYVEFRIAGGETGPQPQVAPAPQAVPQLRPAAAATQGGSVEKVAVKRVGLPFPPMLLRLTSPSLPFWVEVDLREYNGRWLAVAELAGEQELGFEMSPGEALGQALLVLGPDIAARLLWSRSPEESLRSADESKLNAGSSDDELRYDG